MQLFGSSNKKDTKNTRRRGSTDPAAAAAMAQAGASAAAEADADPKNINQVRRRLSVMGGQGANNTLIDGFSEMDIGAGASDDATSGRAIPECWNVDGISKKGYAPYNHRKKNQDVLIMEKDPATNSLYLAVMDGHGEVGDKVTERLKAEIPPKLFKHPAWPTDIEAALAATIAETEAALNDRSCPIDTQFSGTTYTSCVIRNGRLYTANIGDSRVTLGSIDPETGKLVAKALTDDHKPDLPAEKDRILRKGGRVFAVRYDDGIDGPPRVWLGHMDVPGLAMSRSLGDLVAHDAGVSSEPEFKQYDIGPTDQFLVLASDGLWEFMTDQEVVDMAGSLNPADSEDNPLKKTVDALVQEANNRWMREEQVIDDTTVVVALLNDFNKPDAAAADTAAAAEE